MGNWLCTNTLLLFVLKVCPRIVLKYIIIHFITGLNKLITKLVRRHEKHMVKKKTPSFRQYRRVVSSPSKAKPKKNSPAWEINTEDSQQSEPSTHHLCYHHHCRVLTAVTLNDFFVKFLSDILSNILSVHARIYGVNARALIKRLGF